jgi:Ribbon-helix-helix protein, copG family
MGRRRLSQPDEPKPEKISLLLPPPLAARVEEARQRHGITTSALVRRLIEEGIDRWLRPGDAPAPVPPEGGGAGAVTVRLGPELLRALDAAAELWGLDRAALVQLMLAEGLPGYVAGGRERRDELRRLLAPPASTPPEAGGSNS